jgi:hypothetical protein
MRAYIKVAALALLLAGCYSPTIGNGQIACSKPDRKCPKGFVCLGDDLCWKPGTGPSDDGGVSDGGEPSPDLAGITPKGPGESCMFDGECLSTFCADGVCCATDCKAEPCKACNLPGSPGTCTTVVVGAAPAAGHVTCGPDPKTSCMRSGFCDGAGGCALYDNTTVCAPKSCNGTSNTAIADSKCDGMGHCNAPNGITCGPYICDSSSNACFTSCSGTDSSHCSSGNTCSSGSCGLKPIGSSCTTNAECTAPGACIDGVCCNNASCTGACQACNVSPGLGACVTVTNGTGPRCNGAKQCNSSAACVLKNGQSCAGNGDCLSGACIGSVCCNDSTCTGGCQSCGTGTCTTKASGTTSASCGLFLCEGGTACPTTCTSGTQCTTGICNTSPAVCSNVSCFAAGTPVQTPDGPRPLEQIRVGDLVDSFDVRDGTRAPQRVLLVETRHGAGLVSLSVGGGAPIQVTGEHYFWVEGPGWVRAGDLRLGDRLRTPDGALRPLVAAESVFGAADGVTVYNLAVSVTDTYFVGVQPVLVHSCDYMTFSGRPRDAMPQ